MIKKLIQTAFLFLLILPYQSKGSLNVSPYTKVSVLTCSPGFEVYSMYGHTAIRIYDNTLHYDYVVNYGIFSMNIDNFAFLYVSGKTDYEVAAGRFDVFMSEYQYDNRTVYENILNVDTNDIKKIIDALEFDLKPENRVYRYKFHSNNCATKIRDVLERSLSIEWKSNNKNRIPFPQDADFYSLVSDYWKQNTNYSFRETILLYQEKIPWINAAIQIPIAAPADTHMNYRAAMYSPDFLLDAIQNARYRKNDNLLKLSAEATCILKADPSKNPITPSWWSKPLPVTIFIFILLTIITLIGYKKRRLFRFIDILLLLITGVIGIFLLFMSFISVHECMFPNYNLIWAMPLNFFFAFVALFNKKLFIHYYKLISIINISFLALLPLIPQTIPFYLCIFPLIMTVRYGTYYAIACNKK